MLLFFYLPFYHTRYLLQLDDFSVTKITFTYLFDKENDEIQLFIGFY